MPVLPCPKCHQLSAELIGERLASEHEEIPEGLIGVMNAQCQHITCLHEFETVTRGQILRSLSMWSSGHTSPVSH